MAGSERRPPGLGMVDAAEWLLENKTNKNQVSPANCWVWGGYVNSAGYGQVSWQSETWWAHRFFYHAMVDYLPRSSPVHHKCANPSCVNPAHLQALTPRENTAEMMERSSYQTTIVHLMEEVADLKQYIEHLESKLERHQW